jgi:hypothetical protein
MYRPYQSPLQLGGPAQVVDINTVVDMDNRLVLVDARDLKATKKE